MFAKQSTAKTFILGPILDSDGAAKTDEVVASIKVTKNGSVGAVDAQDTLTHNHTGHYVFVSDGGDFDTLGEVEFSLNNGTNAMAPVKFQVMPANVYDALVGGTVSLKTDLETIKTQAVTCAAGVTVLASVGAAAAPGAANGILIGGNNAATTFATLTVTGAMTNGSTVLGNTTMGTLTQSGAASLGAGSTVTLGTLAVTGAVSFGSTLAVTGATTLAAVTTSGAVSFASFSTGVITGTLPAIPNNWITAAGIADAAIDAATFASGALDGVWSVAARTLTAIDEDSTTLDLDATIATAVWNAATSGYGGAGTYGQAAEDVLADTNELQAEWVNGGRLDLIVDAISDVTKKLDTTLIQDGLVYDFTAEALAASPAGAGLGMTGSLIAPPLIEVGPAVNTYRIWLVLQDDEGNMEAPDSTPTMTALAEDGTDYSSDLSAATNSSTGLYYWDWSVLGDNSHWAITFTATVTENAIARKIVATSTLQYYYNGSSSLIAGAITAAAFGADAITSAAIQDGTINKDTFDTGAITAAAIAATALNGKGDWPVGKTGYSLAATGLDAITATEPSGKPTTFPGWIMWLVQRFRRSAKDNSANTITVQTEAGVSVTTQNYTDDGAGNETLGAPS